MMHSIFLAVLRTSEYWHQTGERVGGLAVNLHVQEILDFRNRAPFKVSNISLFGRQIVRGSGPPLRKPHVPATVIEYLPQIG